MLALKRYLMAIAVLYSLTAIIMLALPPDTANLGGLLGSFLGSAI